ncbi:pathogenicity island 2 effector protein SseJ [Salmonella enterica subsp. diarizonae]|uniref:Pathogenicity island 2 effector protein SseJ n=1 Tax=Salmonella diarizonae TaxID=59204 RepID=A0A379U647_SALDZ|nr:pathogenicity island 2 effector protein SseJ [Salmonella enterica subsp. diarizonae]
MGISVGHSYFTATISSETINKMFSSDELPHMTIWECIKIFSLIQGKEKL